MGWSTNQLEVGHVLYNWAPQNAPLEEHRLLFLREREREREVWQKSQEPLTQEKSPLEELNIGTISCHH